MLDHDAALATLRLGALLPAIRRALLRFALVGISPIVAFYTVLRLVGPMEGVLAGTLTAATALAIQARRIGRLDPVGIVPIVAVLIQGGVGLAFQSVDLYLAAPAVENVVWGLALIGSVAIGRPFVALAARELELLPAAVRSVPTVLRALTFVTLVWGLMSFVKSGIRLMLLANLSLEAFLITNTVVITSLNIVLLAFTLWLPLRAARLSCGPRAILSQSLGAPDDGALGLRSGRY